MGTYLLCSNCRYYENALNSYCHFFKRQILDGFSHPIEDNCFNPNKITLRNERFKHGFFGRVKDAIRKTKEKNKDYLKNNNIKSNN